MPQLITKYNSGPLGVSEAADALLDPKSAFRYFLDFMNDVEDGQYTSTVVAASSGTAAPVASAHGGTVLLDTVGTTDGMGVVISSPGDFIVLDGSRTVYAEARLSYSNILASWYFGLTANSPAGSEWGTSSITPGSAVALIGFDAGTDSLTGATAGKSLQLSTYGSSHVESLVPLDFTLAAGTFYRVGILVQGWTVQAYVNGKKYGAPNRLNSNTTTTMGVQLSVVTRGTSARTMTCDYIDVVCTR
jgi:hypothetical protein